MIPWWWNPDPMYYVVMVVTIAMLIGAVGMALGGN